jgi:hypothetical protein
LLPLCPQALSFPFSLIFGSGTLGDKMGVPSERGQVDVKPFSEAGRAVARMGERRMLPPQALRSPCRFCTVLTVVYGESSAPTEVAAPEAKTKEVKLPTAEGGGALSPPPPSHGRPGLSACRLLPS